MLRAPSPNAIFMSLQKRSGGQLLVDGLLGGGIRHAFCVPGESYLAALDAFYARRDHAQIISCRQEGGAAYMAEACGKLTALPGVCLVSRGPGASNAMAGVHTAFQDSTPMLLLIGQNPRAHRGREGFQELDYARVYGGVAKRVLRVEAAAAIPESLREAWASAVNGRPGPVVMELPEDMLRETAAAADCAMPAREVCSPSAQQLAHLNELLNASKRPLLICGGAAWTPAANGLLAEFAARHAIPVACAFRRQDMFDNSDAQYAGELGLAASDSLIALAKDSDLVIAVGARLGEMTTAAYTLFDVPEFDARGVRKLAHVYPHAGEIDSVFTAALGIESDAETFLRAAPDIAPPKDLSARKKRVAHAHEKYLEHTCKPRDVDAPLRIDAVVAHLREQLAAEDIVTVGAGNYTVWPQRHYMFTKPGTQLAATNGSMGYGLPAAIAAKILRPQSRVVCFAGDGCFLMNGQELATAVQYDAHVICIVVNNHSYGTIRMHQQRRYPNRPIATALRNPDFAALARAYGAFGASVARTEDFPAAFAGALAAHSPALIELPLDEDFS